MYKLKFKSRGDSAVTQRVVEVLKDVCIPSLSWCITGLTFRRLGIPHVRPSRQSLVEKTAAMLSEKAVRQPIVVVTGVQIYE